MLLSRLEGLAGAGALARAASRSQRRSVAAKASSRVLITGGNTGIGYETARALLASKDKEYEVVLACRDTGKASAAVKKLQETVPGARVTSVPLDLADLASVRDCASRLLDQGSAFDVVLNNAGVMACPKMATKDGFEYQLGINHLGHFLLTSMLLPSLVEANKPVRIINVASMAHLSGKIDFDDLMRDKTYAPWDAYGQSKLANILYSYELAKKLRNHRQITVNCLHPGVVKTELGRYMFADASSSWYMPAVLAVASVFLKTPEQGAETSIYLASSPEVEGISSKYFVDCKPVSSSRDSYNGETAKRLYEVSMELTKAPAHLLTPVHAA